MTIRSAPPGRTSAADSSGSSSPAENRWPPAKRVEPIAASAASGGVTAPRAVARGKVSA